MNISEPIVFYDIPGNAPEHMAWSPNTWKIRYVLNYKGLKYRTEWVEYPDIEDLCKAVGAPPTDTKPDGRAHYTLPVIQDPNTKTVIADSDAIAKYLEHTYPDTPTLFPDGTRAFQHAFFQLARPAIQPAVLHLVIPHVWALLRPRSQEYYRRTREQVFGRALEEIPSEGDWAILERSLAAVRDCLDANGEGRDTLLMGDRITWADFQLASLLIWLRVATGEESEDWKRLLTLHGGRWGGFMQQFVKYESVNL